MKPANCTHKWKFIKTYNGIPKGQIGAAKRNFKICLKCRMRARSLGKGNGWEEIGYL